MARTGRIVVGVDGSDTSRDAVTFAAESARASGADLHVVHAFVRSPSRPQPSDPIQSDPAQGSPAQGSPPQGVPPDAGPRSEAERQVADAVATARAVAPGARITSDLVTGTPAAALIQESRLADAIVVGNRGRGGFPGLMAGSVGVTVAAHAVCPVAVVRPRDGTGPSSGRVVVGVDGSSTSTYALAIGFREASLRGVGITVIHGWMAPPSLGEGPMPLAYDPETVDRKETLLLRDLTDEWTRAYPDLDLQQRVMYAKPNKLLVEESRGAELVVVGARGRGGFRGLLLGSVSHAVLHHAHCPVVVARGGPDEPGA